MDNRIINTVILLVLALVVGGAGFYKTKIDQPRKLDDLQQVRGAVGMHDVEASRLFEQQASTSAMAEETWRKWRARYRVIPEELETADIVIYTEGLTRNGFRNFDIRLDGITRGQHVSNYTYSVTGRAFYSSLYDFIWHIENDRPFYRIRDLTMSHTDVFSENPETGVDRRHNMVNFSFKLDAYFNAREGVSAVEDESLMPLQRAWLPVHNPPHNSFYPLVRSDLPPNDEMLVNVDEATLVSIIGDQAILRDKNGFHYLKEGDNVYLGRITLIDASRARVLVTLSRGGVTQEMEMRLGTETNERIRDSRIVPVN